tara:strand:+ start:75 stop:542 length:468 start_codon:yes stop_codon:yes gene_type:complete
MDIHILFISGMDEEDTNAFFIKEGWNDMPIYKDQINRQTKVMRLKKPIRVTLWCVLNTPIIEDLIVTIKCHIKYVVFLYHGHKPITLMRCIGFHQRIKQKNIVGIILSTNISRQLNHSEYNFNKNLIENMLDLDDKELPHYNLKLNSIIKLFINI